jgi:hypothetical protein
MLQIKYTPPLLPLDETQFIDPLPSYDANFADNQHAYAFRLHHLDGVGVKGLDGAKGENTLWGGLRLALPGRTVSPSSQRPGRKTQLLPGSPAGWGRSVVDAPNPGPPKI